MGFWSRSRPAATTPDPEPQDTTAFEAPSPAPPGNASESGLPAGVPQAWLNGSADASLVAGLLREVIDPEIGVNIVDLGLVYNIRISEKTATIQMSLTTPGCPLSAYMEDSVHRMLWGTPGIDDVDLRIIWEPPWGPEMMSARAKRELGWPT